MLNKRLPHIFPRHLAASSLAIIVITIVGYVWSEKQIYRANNLRYQSFLLADELRQSSDDLTRMARAYVATGNPLYKKNYQAILDIRDGKKPRPERYQNIYWDIESNEQTSHQGSGQPIALLELMRRAGFSKDEFRKLAQAKANSDALTSTEFTAMRLVETTGPEAEANRDMARMMMHDDKYDKAKATIMNPIDELMKKRTFDAVQAAIDKALILRAIFIGLGLGLILMLWWINKSMHLILGGSVDEIYAYIVKIGCGDFSSAIPVADGRKNSILGWLAKTQANLNKIDDERKQVEEKLHLAASVFTHVREGIMITATDGTIIEVNDAFSDITGYSRDEVQGRNPRFLSSGRHEKDFYAAMWRDLIEKDQWSGEIWNRHKDGKLYAEMLTISAVHDAQGNARQYVALFTDITSLKENERRLEHIARFDALTSLPNRVLLADRLQLGMSQARRRSQRLGVAFLDLDGFKAINDNYGHEAGDQLLIALATRMKQALREGDTLARLGGDEFVAVLADIGDIDDSVPILSRLLNAAAQPVHIDGLMLQVSASLGVTFYPQAEGIDADQLLRQADQAMYQAKLEGKNRYHFFDAEQDSRIRNHHESLERIRRALHEREFVLYYQPKVNMRTGTIIGAEALIRWQHPERGLLLPTVFLPEIEDHPLAVELGEWVIDSALTQLELWHAEGLDIPVSVNVCARQLQQTDFVDRLRARLSAHPGASPGNLVMEVLETSALEDLVHVSKVINACREIGVMFALDDFGTGYSSLTHLKRLPVTQLKIDQTFVSSMLDSPDDLAILEGVLGMAAAFQHQVIAEGVETIEHGEMLLQFDCELAQGYCIARPMPAHEMSGWSSAWRTEPSWCDLPAVNHDDLPLLVASAEHRAWIAALEAFFKDEREAPPPMDRHQCRFGMWLDTKGLVRYGAQPAFETIELLHRQVHVLGAELLELRVRGSNPEALERLGELHDLRDALLKQLKMLVLEIQQ